MWPCLCCHIVFCSIVAQISQGLRAKFDSVIKGTGQLEAKQKFSSLYCKNDPTESAAKNCSMTLAYIALHSQNVIVTNTKISFKHRADLSVTNHRNC